MENELTRKEPYFVKSKDGKSSLPLFYVRREYLNSTGKEWETFYTMIHDIQAHIHLDDFSFKRVRVPVEDIEIDENRFITSKEKTFESKPIWYDERVHTPLVNSWLMEVEEIMKETSYVNIKDIFRGKRQWACNKVIPPCVLRSF